MMKKQNICTAILFFLLLMLVACKSHKGVTEQVFAKTDSVATNKVDSVTIQRTVTVKDTSEVRESAASEYIIGKFDSTAGARVDTVKQYRYHYERKATERDKTDSEKQKSAATTFTSANTKQSEVTTKSTTDKQGKGLFYVPSLAVTIAALAAIALAYIITRYFTNKK